MDIFDFLISRRGFLSKPYGSYCCVRVFADWARHWLHKFVAQSFCYRPCFSNCLWSVWQIGCPKIFKHNVNLLFGVHSQMHLGKFSGLLICSLLLALYFAMKTFGAVGRDPLVGWLVGLLVGLLVGWLVGWLIAYCVFCAQKRRFERISCIVGWLASLLVCIFLAIKRIWAHSANLVRCVHPWCLIYSQKHIWARLVRLLINVLVG